MNLNVLWTDVGKEQELESEGWIEFGSLERRGKQYWQKHSTLFCLGC